MKIEGFTEETGKATDDNTKQKEDNTDNTDNTDVVNVVEKIFKNAQLYILAAFLVIYLIVFIGGGMFMQASETTVKTTFDFVMFGAIFIYIVYKYMNLEQKEKDNILNTSLSNFVELYDNDLALFSIMLFVIGFYLLLFLLRVPLNENKPSSVLVIEGISWFLLATLAIHNCLKYLFNIDLLDYLREKDYQKYLGNVLDAETDVSGNPIIDTSGNLLEEETQGTPEVFNVSNNLYTYEDAQAVCKALDSRLATYEEVESAYNNGAEWCNYGWSADQLALFPTQTKTWRALQGDCKTKNRCGRPGVNGGYFRNPKIKFGVNCYGIKPQQTDDDKERMNLGTSVPLTEADKHLEERVKYWKENSDRLKLNSFNKTNWSRY